MSGIYLLGLMATWLFVGWMLYKFWRATKSPIKDLSKTTYYIFGMVLFVIWFGSGFWPFAGKKMYYDAQIREMCVEDGGIKVYETVLLPVNMFNRWDQPEFYDPTLGEDALGSDYIFKVEIDYYKKQDPIVSRRSYRVIRKLDSKLIGESVVYGRGGGDLPGPWHGSNYHCPDEGGDIPLLVKIFKPSKRD
ncbi:MAG: hypothetical protein KZQ94_01225 [Candidatus Thiodiazotropha sp. (ex Troendleina suluensis)]|nr:hypothetical protein [Candidatus Thiodiazotropha sp. (ex Troendleina suluensis)]